MSSETEQKNAQNEPASKGDASAGAVDVSEGGAASGGKDGAAPASSDKTSQPEGRRQSAQAEQFEPDVPLEGRIFRHKYFVSVSKRSRIIGFLISLVCLATLVYLNISYTPHVAAGSSHIVEIKDAGIYLVLFKGEITDPYAWASGGPQRVSLRVKIEAVEPPTGPMPKVIEHINYKNLAGVNYFSIAEFEITEPGDYIVTSTWTNPQASADGYIVLEQDPVEKFFARWFCGILGGIAFLIAVGFPVSSRMAAATEERK